MSEADVPLVLTRITWFRLSCPSSPACGHVFHITTVDPTSASSLPNYSIATGCLDES